MLVKATYKILNKELSSANASQYRMSINVKIDGLSLLIIDGDSIINAFGYQWQVSSWNQASQNIADIIDDNKFLSYFYKSISVFIDSQESMLIPKDFYSITRQQSLLEAYTGSNDFTAHSQRLKKEDLYLVFGVFNDINTLIKKKFSRAKVYHNTAFSIDNALENGEIKPTISIRINNNSFEVIASDKSKLIAHNNFTYKTLDEFIFFVLSFAKQNNIDVNTAKLNIIEPLLMSSPIAIQLRRYFPNITEYTSKSNDNEVVFDTFIKNTISANN